MEQTHGLAELGSYGPAAYRYTAALRPWRDGPLVGFNRVQAVALRLASRKLAVEEKPSTSIDLGDPRAFVAREQSLTLGPGP